METLTLVELGITEEPKWYSVDKNDIVNSFVDDTLKIVDNDIVKKFNIKSGDRVDTENEELTDALDSCEFVPNHRNNGYCIGFVAVNLSEIEKDRIYVSGDYFYTGADVLAWDTEKYYLYTDGSTAQSVLKIGDDFMQVEAEIIDSENYKTDCGRGKIMTYKTKNGKILKINCSYMSGDLDEVENIEVLEG